MRSEPDRDRVVERLLRQSLRPGAFTSPGPCLETDTLAAWADGVLSSDELAAAEAHLSDCSRCQSLLAAITRLTPAVAPAEPWWRRRSVVSVLVPVTAAAAALTLWVAVPRHDTRDALEEARAGAAQAPSPSPLREPPREEPRAFAGRAPASGTADDTPQTRADKSRRETRPEATDVAREQERRSPARGRRDAQGMTAPEVASPEVAARKAAARKAAVPEAAAREAAVPEAAVPPAPAPGASRANAVQPFRDAAAAPMAKAASAEVLSPDRSSRWRPGPAGSVEYSSDGGSTWQTLSTGIATELTSGASPSPSVCWLVGRAGTILLTTDGRRFQRVPFPEAVDLIAVSATDARTATVTTADGRRFTTADGGPPWRPF